MTAVIASPMAILASSDLYKNFRVEQVQEVLTHYFVHYTNKLS